MRNKPYLEMYDTQIQWLGEVPVSWDIRRLKYCLELVNEKLGSPPSGESYIGLENIESHTGHVFWPNENGTAEGTCNVFKPGDVLFGKLRPYLAKAAIMQTGGVCSTELLVFRPRKVDAKFLWYFLLSDGFIKTVDSSTYGAKMPRASWEFIGNLPMLMPHINEQKNIGRFLDTQTAQIDELIALKEKQIELLGIKRQAIISQAVTRGLNPDARMKPSGLDWLGEIPEHWQLIRLKFLKREPFMYGANEVSDIDDPDLPRYVRITDIKEDGSLRDDTFRSLPENIAEPYLLKEGDFLFARSGATVGKAFMYSIDWGKACFAGYLIRFRPNLSKLRSGFIKFFLQSVFYENQVGESTIQATIQNVSAEKYSNFWMAVPPLANQDEIIAYLEDQTSQIDKVINLSKVQIDALREYRQLLITSAVTGKIDLRGVEI